MTDEYTWDDMLADFRRLGGVADNVVRRRGEHGLGLFPIDPSRPVVMHVPEHLLIDDDQLEVVDGNLGVSSCANVPAEVKLFYERYLKHYSWGADGRTYVEYFERGLQELPKPLLERLNQLGLLNLTTRHAGPWEEVLRTRFVATRRINYKRRKVLMPVIELINHSPRAPNFQINDGIGFEGNFEGEITANYSLTNDSLLRFLNYGFANQEPVAYSLPVTFKLDKNLTIVIGLNPEALMAVDRMILPRVEREGMVIKISHLRLGIERAPRMPKTILRKVLPDMPATVVDEIFERVRNANLVTLCELLELSDEANHPIGLEFRRAIRYQLRALAYAYGARQDI